MGHGNLCVQTTAWAFGAMIAISVAWFVLTQAIHNSINPGGAKPDGTQAFIIINALLPMVLLEKIGPRICLSRINFALRGSLRSLDF